MNLLDFINYIYHLALVSGVFLAFGMLIYGGFRYLISAGNPTIMADAKDQILAAILGLVILFSSYLILVTIDPRLVILKPPAIEPPPVVEPPPYVPPEERIYTFQEIPIGILISRALEKELLDEIKEVSKNAKSASEELKKLTEELKVLTDQCACENTTPNATVCDYWEDDCPATECLGDPCPNREEINAKIEEINSKIEDLENHLTKVAEVRQELIERLDHLQTGEDYLAGKKEGCTKMEIISHDLMVWWEKGKEGRVEIINLFPEFIPGIEEIPLINRDILNFYCKI